jgi:hypothetical protein
MMGYECREVELYVLRKKGLVCDESSARQQTAIYLTKVRREDASLWNVY